MTMSTLRTTALALTLLPALAFASPADDRRDESDKEAMNGIIGFLANKDCKGAVKELNQGIANNQRAMLLMAGSLYEQGLCVKPDWDSAAHYYLRAQEAGKREALPRLISGFAEKNRDPGAALWWMAKSKASVVPECNSANPLAGNPDAFVAELNKWPKGKVYACVYTTGVVQRIVGDIEFPSKAQLQGIRGDLIMDFVPSTGTITWTIAEVDKTETKENKRPGRDAKSIFTNTYLKLVRELGERSLKQFTKPEGIDPAWTVRTKFPLG